MHCMGVDPAGPQLPASPACWGRPVACAALRLPKEPARPSRSIEPRTRSRIRGNLPEVSWASRIRTADLGLVRTTARAPTAPSSGMWHWRAGFGDFSSKLFSKAIEEVPNTVARDSALGGETLGRIRAVPEEVEYYDLAWAQERADRRVQLVELPPATTVEGGASSDDRPRSKIETSIGPAAPIRPRSRERRARNHPSRVNDFAHRCGADQGDDPALGIPWWVSSCEILSEGRCDRFRDSHGQPARSHEFRCPGMDRIDLPLDATRGLPPSILAGRHRRLMGL